MSASNANQRYRLQPTDWQAITRHFPGSTFDSDQKSWRVVAFLGNTLSVPELQGALSRQISHLEGIRLGRLPNVTDDSAETTDEANVLEGLAAEWGLSLSETPRGRSENSLVVQSQIRLISPSLARIMFYPRGLRCDRCGFYVLHTDIKKIGLRCADCGYAPMRQVSLLFVCPKCAGREELRPRYADIDREGPVFRCVQPDCKGHLRLELRREDLGESKWVCSLTESHKEQVVFFCSSCRNSANRAERMELKATTATFLRPLVLSAVYVEGSEGLDLAIIKPEVRLSEDDDFDQERKNVLSSFGIKDVMILDDVKAYTAVYGYSTYKDEATPQFFRMRNPDTNQYEYLAYVTQSVGKGLVVMLDKTRVASTALKALVAELERVSPTSDLIGEARERLQTLTEAGRADEVYAWLVNQTKTQLDALGDKASEKLAPLFRLLHSLEHALTYQSVLQSGLEDGTFVGKVLLDDCAVMIYEQQNVEAGGVEYIYKDRLVDWLLESIKHVRDCRYECVEGCVKCLFINDPLCHPFMPNDTPGMYVFPNSLISRRLLCDFWGIAVVPSSTTAQGGVTGEGTLSGPVSLDGDNS